MTSPHITECQIFITRKCNLNCGYCNLTKKPLIKELTISEWQTAFTNLEKIGIKTVKILGGEPTIIQGLDKLIKFINENTSLKYALLSNSLFDQEQTQKLIQAKIQGYFASLDGLADINNLDNQTTRKSQAGWQKLIELKNSGVKLLGANIVIHKQNLQNIPKMVKILSDNGIWTNLCLIIHGQPNQWEYRTTIAEQYKFNHDDIAAINLIMKQLIKLKRQGYKIAVPESYLANMAKYGIDLNWKCKNLYQLRLDADGALMICNDIRGKLAEKYNILDLNEKKFAQFKTDWLVASERINCPGCYWSCFLHAQNNLKHNKLEFDYIN